MCLFSRTAALFLVLPAILIAPLAAHAASCTTQAAMQAPDRDALAAAAGSLAAAVAQQDFASLRTALLASEASEWDGIRGAIEQAAPLVSGGQIRLRNLYLLDATSLSAPADTQFFCSNSNGSLTVTITLPALPPGRYAVILADAVGSPLAGQLGFILGWQTGSSAPGWKLGGFFAHEGLFDGHDGVWFWTRARELARTGFPWSAFYCYEMARHLLVPVNFLTSPNLDKLGQEQGQIKDSPRDLFPWTLADGPRTWKVDTVRVDTTLHQADLGVTFESVGVTDPAAARTEAVAVLSALLKVHPGMRENFHGLWAYAMKDGKRTFAIELPMAQIP